MTVRSVRLDCCSDSEGPIYIPFNCEKLRINVQKPGFLNRRYTGADNGKALFSLLIIIADLTSCVMVKCKLTPYVDICGLTWQK